MIKETIGPATLYHADSLEVLPRLSDIDAVITDPPFSSGGAFRGDRMQKTSKKYQKSGGGTVGAYGEFSGDNRDQRSYLAWSSLWMAAAYRSANPGAIIACFTDWRQLPVTTDAVQCGGWVWRNLATW